MRGQHSLWAYPWDLHDLGGGAALAELALLGVNTISLATSYHAGRFLQPGNPRRRIWYPQDGTVYFRPDPARWDGHEIVPLMADIVPAEGDMLTTVTESGLALSCWTVCLHNTRLGMMHPGHVLRTAHGDAQYYGLCPSSPAARAYVTTLVAEVADRFRPARIELESPDFMGFDHGYHHEKDGLPALPEDAFLLGICFCDHCQTRAQAAGVDAGVACARARDLLDAAFARELPQAQFPDFPALGISAFAGEAALLDYLCWRSEPVTSLLAEIHETVAGKSRILLIDFAESWWGGLDAKAAIRHVDGILHCAYFTPPTDIGPLMEKTRAVIGPDKTLIAGFQLFHPNVADRADLAARVASAAPHVDGCNFYNLGLVPPARLGWIRTALAAFA